MSESDIACMGELGACAAGAGAYAFPFAHVMPQPSYQQALEALIEGVAGRALIPAYNTRTGAMPDALGLLARSDFEIVGEVWREIELHVLVPRAWVEAQHPGYNDLPLPEKARARAGLLGLIAEIYADQAAFNQYGGFLKRALRVPTAASRAAPAKPRVWSIKAIARPKSPNAIRPTPRSPRARPRRCTGWWR